MPSSPPDYFPLRAGLCWEYRTKNAEGSGLLRIAVLSVIGRGQVVKALCRRSTEWGGKAKTAKFTVTKDARGVFSGREKEFPLPPAAGARWSLGSNDCSVEALDAVATVPAGTFRGCLKVVWLVGGGAGGGGERFYAPGVGLVREASFDETDPYEHVLLRTSVGAVL